MTAPEPAIDRASLRLQTGQYFPEEQTKTGIVLHHTVGGSAASTLKWWQADPRRVATAYLVERDGRIYEVFPPEAWAWHANVKAEDFERRTIGIELCSEGALEAAPDPDNPGRLLLYAFQGAGRRLLGPAERLLEERRVIHFSEGWRGYSWFDQYDDRQVAASIALVAWLCERFRIPARIPLEAYLPAADPRRWYAFAGVLHHTMLRADKSDLHPGFPFWRLAQALGDDRWKGLPMGGPA